jgi:hypothetical protein
MNYPREQAQAHQQPQAQETQAHHQQQQQSTGIQHQVVNAHPRTRTDPMITSTSTASKSTSTSSSKSNKSQSNKSKSNSTSKITLATSEFESSPCHKKKQFQHQKKDRAHRDDIMIPSISKHRYSPSPSPGNSSSSSSSNNSKRNSSSRQRAMSPASTKKSISGPISIEDGKRLQESLLLLSLSPVTNNNSKNNASTDNNNNNIKIDLPPLMPIEVVPPLIPIEVVDMAGMVNDDDNNNNNDNTYNINIPTGMTARLSRTFQDVGEEILESGYASTSSDDEDISKYGYGDDTIPSAAELQEQQYQLQQQQYSNEQQQQQLQEEQKQEEYDDYGGYEEDGADNTFIADDEEADEADSAAKYGYGDCEPSTSENTEEEEALIDQLLSSQYAPTNEYSSTAFCPNRVPRRSSMKSNSPSSRSSSNTSRGSRRRRSSIDEDLLAMPSLSSNTARITEDHIEVLLPGRPKHDTIRRRRSITFDNDVDVQKIEPIKSLAGKDGSKSLWFQENEYETIKIKTLALLDRVDHTSGIIDGKKYCTRGLEKFMTPEASEVKKHQAWDAVLNEQFLQRKDGENDEETLANIYRYSTKRSQSEASKRANQDAVAAEAYLKTTFRRRQSYDKKLEEWKARNGPQFANRRCSM